MTLAPGMQAPGFTLPGAGGETIDLGALAGRKVVLYFYPKDDTSGCTLEAQNFNAQQDAFAEADAIVIGVSPDSVKSHDKFRAKHGLTFPLAADEEKGMLEAYGVWVEKSMYGRKYMGVARITYLIGPDGKVLKRWDKVSPSAHADEVLGQIQAL